LGDPKKPRKKYATPRSTWQTDQIARELWLVGKYGLRNKRELWIAETELSRIRNQARKLLAEPIDTRAETEKRLLLSLIRKGLIGSSSSLDDILGLTVESLLERRLQSMVKSKGLALSIQAARQAVTHGHIKVGNRRVTIPGFLVRRDEESTVRIIEGSTLAKLMVEAVPSAQQEE
jgi:small subunit ribosomal protein S4|tara:strand:+ start:763 stop:1290 length:528 start_codon:yes stop_codon:yes gene_type:complete